MYRRLVVVSIMTMTAVAPLVPQETRAALLGRITDASGAVIPGAQVQAMSKGTAVTASTRANAEGNYVIPYLLPGEYRVSVQAQGFNRSVRETVELRVNDRVALDFVLQVGDVSQQIVVTGEVPLIDTTAASVGMVMDTRRMTDLPTGANVLNLARLSAGVLKAGGNSPGQPWSEGAGSGAVVVSGTRSGSSEVMLDGVPNQLEGSNTYTPPRDLVQEVKVFTAWFDATQGHAVGAVSNVSIKSGTNTLHGAIYLADARINAAQWFANYWLYNPTTGPINDAKRRQVADTRVSQQYSATFTGPIRIPRIHDGRNRSFFSFGYQFALDRRQMTYTGTVPTADQRRGDFSALLRVGPQYQIYDPATIAPAAGGRFSRQPLAGNRVPASRINPISQRLLEYLPEPNSPGTSDGSQNYFRGQRSNNDWSSWLVRLDHNYSERHRAFLRSNTHGHETEAQDIPTIAFGNRTNRRGYGLALDDVFVINPQTLLNARYGLTYQSRGASRFSQGFDIVSLGFPQSLDAEIRRKTDPAGLAFPNIVIDGGAFSEMGAPGGNSSGVYYHTGTGTLSRLAGAHNLRIGGEFRLMRENGYNFGNVAPRVEFGQAWTRGPLDTSPVAPLGQGLASMLLGLPTGGRINVNASRAEQSTFSALFLQDDWRLSRRLVMNLGLRYEYEGPTTERFDRSLRGFDFAAASPISQTAAVNYARAPIPEVAASGFRTLGGLTFANVNGQPRSLWQADKNNFAPRIGLALQLTSKTVVRAGYGVFFNNIGIDRQDVNQGGFSQTTNLVPSLDNGLTFRATLSNPFPDGLLTPPGASDGLRTFLGRAVSFFPEKPIHGYMQRWSFSVQRELPLRSLMEISYVGNRGTKLPILRELDPAPQQYLSTSPVRDQPAIDFLNAQVSNPFYGIADFAGSALAGLRVARSQLLRPYPHFTSITAYLPLGYSHYHSLQATVEKRWGQGFTVQGSWTWSKFMEATGFLSEADLRPEKVISNQDYTHRLAISGIYELPIGRGKPFLGSAGRGLDLVVGGWQVQGWYEAQSGQPLGFGNAIFNGALHDIPLPDGQRRVERWFNTDAGFERNPARQLAGNVRRFPSRFTGVRSDGLTTFFLSVFKSFPIRERVKLQFRAEAYNALNHPQFGVPNTTPASTAFGTVTQQLAGGVPRVLGFALRLSF